MKQLPVLSGKDIIKSLKTLGFHEISLRGSHVKLKRSSIGETRTVIVPLHDELGNAEVNLTTSRVNSRRSMALARKLRKRSNPALLLLF